mmetsp:Transcript_38753/g.153103  ORF Transcript_38753/g.153103 Transcript_38753/m.153103 type:complete len:866 (+) Transcript_38753:266-2863(+)
MEEVEAGRSASRVRNICVLAHVDHGKTSLTDSLLAASGYIHARSAGQLRFLDSREDEQRRGITMKSSSAVLLHKQKVGDDEHHFVVNLVDSPGHVDFTGEVESAMSVCDGALLVVDVGEGVCAQTVTVLRLAMDRGIQPVLVLNKMDRLFTELKMEPMDAYRHINNILEQVNVIVGVRDLDSIIRASENYAESGEDADGVGEDGGAGWSVDEDVESTTKMFSPANGNVAFASAIDGWAFRVENFASMFAKKFGLKRETLVRSLWGDYYVNAKTRRIVHGADKLPKKALPSPAKPMFVGFVLDNIWKIYESVRNSDPESMRKRSNIVEKLNLKVNARDYGHRDGKVAVRAMMNSWLPAAKGLLDMVVEKLPSPVVAQRNRLGLLWPHSKPDNVEGAEAWLRMKNAMENCDSSEGSPFIAFVSKMIQKPEDGSQPKIRQPKPREESKGAEELQAPDTNVEAASAPSTWEEQEFVAFTRVLSGSVKAEDQIYVYGPRFQSGSHQGWTNAEVAKVVLLMGRDMSAVEKVSAGSVCGVEGLDNAVLKTATLSNIPPEQMLPLASRLGGSETASDLVVRVALEPHTPLETERLQLGMKKLNQADPMVDTYVMETGELVLAVTGELHLERCLVDLRERFAKGVRFHVSEPIISFRETVSTTGPTVVATTANKQVSITLKAMPIPTSVARKLDQEAPRIRTLLGEAKNNHDHVSQPEELRKMRGTLVEVFEREEELFNMMKSRLWSSGPRSFGTNILLGPPQACKFPCYSKSISMWRGLFFDYEPDECNSLNPTIANGIVAGFQHTTAAGPLCEEAIYGVCFAVEDIHIDDSVVGDGPDPYGPLSGQIISSVKEALRNTIMSSQPRLVEALLR